MKVLVVGKGGSGKSALVNSLRRIDREDPEAAPESDSGYSATDCVRRYVSRRDDVDIELYDSPGLDDKKGAQRVLGEARGATNGDVNVVIFCIALSRGLRIDDTYTDLMSALVETFDHSLWSQLIFVLTFSEDTSQGRLKMKNVTEQLTRAMMSAGAATEAVTVLPAGYTEKQERENWSKKIIDSCVERGNSKCIFSPQKKATLFRWPRRNRLVFTFGALGLCAYIMWGTAGVAAVGVMILLGTVGLYWRQR